MEINSFFNNLEKYYATESLSNQYKVSSPIKHIIVDNFFPEEIYKNLCNDIRNYPADKWIHKNLGNTSGPRKETRDFTGSDILQNIMLNLTGHNFISWMTKITGVEGIIPDPHYLGAGITSTPRNSQLGLHIDFNWNNSLKLNRAFNLIIYSNPEWKSEWNGQLEFWNRSKTEKLLTVEPTPNRLIFWEYEQEFFHGFTEPILCPEDIERQNLMSIYYLSNSTPLESPHKSVFY
jgi:Rps23 Pro-64 3,4-dihydroxylase Tpa1-like proline 4-hydroxylase